VPAFPHKGQQWAGSAGRLESMSRPLLGRDRVSQISGDLLPPRRVSRLMSASQVSSRRLALLSGFAVLAVLGAGSVCSAESPWRRRIVPAPPPPYRVSLEEAGGAALPTFHHAGTTYVLGEPGERYRIRVENPTGERVEAVVSVDGRDAISGELGDYVSQRGYLIEPWGTLVVEGFRQSLDEVAAFRFTGRGRSYSALRGTPEHVGVIGVAVFPEKARPRPVLHLRQRWGRTDGRAAPSAAGASPPEQRELESRDAAPRKKGAEPSNIGTEYGESRESSVTEVAFERRTPTHPVAVLSLRYDDYSGLEARGVDLSSLGYAYESETEPHPFPRSRFAPPP